MTNEEIVVCLDDFILSDMKKSLDEISRLKNENTRLREALTPFSNTWKKWVTSTSDPYDYYPFMVDGELCHKAHEALEYGDE